MQMDEPIQPQAGQVNQEEEMYQNAISYEEELLEQPNEMFFHDQNEPFEPVFATEPETLGGEYVRSQYDEEQSFYYDEYEEDWNGGWQQQDDYWE